MIRRQVNDEFLTTDRLLVKAARCTFPHAWLYFEAKNDTGQPAIWVAEGATRVGAWAP